MPQMCSLARGKGAHWFVPRREMGAFGALFCITPCSRVVEWTGISFYIRGGLLSASRLPAWGTPPPLCVNIKQIMKGLVLVPGIHKCHSLYISFFIYSLTLRRPWQVRGAGFIICLLRKTTDSLIFQVTLGHTPTKGWRRDWELRFLTLFIKPCCLIIRHGC